MREILLIGQGQSNLAGAACMEGGVVKAKHTSIYGSQTDPFPGCNNLGQGGSMFPYLIDRGRARGVNYTVLNYAIGGASVYHYTGRSGAAVSGGDAATPASVGYMGSIGLSGGSGVPAEIDADFDPFDLLSRSRTAIADPTGYESVVGIWSNGEADAGLSAAAYQAGLEAVADYMLDSGVDALLIGLTSKHASASSANFNALQTGVTDAIAALVGETKPVFAGANLWAHYASTPPLYPETDASTRVHLTLRGQEVHAWLWDAKLAAAGY